jgi:hypothetical protein
MLQNTSSGSVLSKVEHMLIVISALVSPTQTGLRWTYLFPCCPGVPWRPTLPGLKKKLRLQDLPRIILLRPWVKCCPSKSRREPSLRTRMTFCWTRSSLSIVASLLPMCLCCPRKELRREINVRESRACPPRSWKR